METYNFIQKETPTQVCFCEFGEIFKGNFFVKHLRATASENIELYVKSQFHHSRCFNFSGNVMVESSILVVLKKPVKKKKCSAKYYLFLMFSNLIIIANIFKFFSVQHIVV